MLFSLFSSFSSHSIQWIYCAPLMPKYTICGIYLALFNTGGFMINTKLILIDGMTGAGKSTSAHFLGRQLEKNNIKVRWYPEEKQNHPLVYSSPTDKSLTPEERRNAYLEGYPKQWACFAKEAAEFDGVTIIESYLIQYALISLVSAEKDRRTIADFAHLLLKQIAELNPVIIYLYSNDIHKGLWMNLNRRGDEWKEWYLSRLEKSPYAQKHELNGEETALHFLTELTQSAEIFLKETTFPVLKIENSQQNWELYRWEMMNFLGLSHIQETTLREEDHRFCGKYRILFDNEELIYRVHLNEQRLCIDTFWPNMKLLPKTENLFELEGYYFTFEFVEENEKVTGMKVSKELFTDDQDVIFERID